MTANDQSKINSFAKWNVKLKEYEAEVETKKVGRLSAPIIIVEIVAKSA